MTIRLQKRMRKTEPLMAQNHPSGPQSYEHNEKHDEKKKKQRPRIWRINGEAKASS